MYGASCAKRIERSNVSLTSIGTDKRSVCISASMPTSPRARIVSGPISCWTRMHGVVHVGRSGHVSQIVGGGAAGTTRRWTAPLIDDLQRRGDRGAADFRRHPAVLLPQQAQQRWEDDPAWERILLVLA